MSAKDVAGTAAADKRAEQTPARSSDQAEAERIQKKQGGHHLPAHPDDGPPLDDTDRNSDRIIKPVRLHRD